MALNALASPITPGLSRPLGRDVRFLEPSRPIVVFSTDGAAARTSCTATSVLLVAAGVGMTRRRHIDPQRLHRAGVCKMEAGPVGRRKPKRGSTVSKVKGPKQASKLAAAETKQNQRKADFLNQVTPQEVAEAKARLKALCAVENNGQYYDEETIALIEQEVGLLEEANRIKYPATLDSKMLNGEWKLLWCQGNEYSSVGEVTQTIDIASKRILDVIDLSIGKATRKDTWIARGSNIWDLERITQWVPSIFGLGTEWLTFDDEDGDTAGSIDMTYTDEDFRIVSMQRVRKGEATVDMVIWVRK